MTTSPTSTVIDGCESVSHTAGSPIGALVVHGFTGSPFSVRGVVDAVVGAGYDVEAPRLPGHGTTVDDMIPTRWDDWSSTVAAAHDALADRVESVIAVGQSMGATLAIWAALRRKVSAVACINPLTRPRSADEIELIDDLIDDGLEIAPGGGSDIADPDSYDISYDGTPLAAIRSLLVDGVAPLSGRFDELAVPLRLFTSRNDHVVDPADSDHLVDTWAGPVERTWLERSFHVATRDYERTLVEQEIVSFIERVWENR